MEKYQLTFITGNEKLNSEKKFVVYGNESEARAALSLYTEVKKQKEKKKSGVIELTKVTYQNDKACTGKFVCRKYVKESGIIKAEEKTVEVKKKSKTKKA